jgi:hypothetical protein
MIHIGHQAGMLARRATQDRRHRGYLFRRKVVLSRRGVSVSPGAGCASHPAEEAAVRQGEIMLTMIILEHEHNEHGHPLTARFACRHNPHRTAA